MIIDYLPEATDFVINPGNNNNNNNNNMFGAGVQVNRTMRWKGGEECRKDHENVKKEKRPMQRTNARFQVILIDKFKENENFTKRSPCN